MANRINVARLIIFLTIGLLASSRVALAEQVTLTVKLTILVPTCEINGDKVISVDFGEILTERVNGSNYLKPVEYSLKCTGSDSQMFNMSIQGIPASFNDSALETNITDFGVALLANGEALKINDSIAFTPAKKPVLQVVPIKANNARLTGGSFSANAVMKISYQ